MKHQTSECLARRITCRSSSLIWDGITTLEGTRHELFASSNLRRLVHTEYVFPERRSSHRSTTFPYMHPDSWSCVRTSRPFRLSDFSRCRILRVLPSFYPQKGQRTSNVKVPRGAGNYRNAGGREIARRIPEYRGGFEENRLDASKKAVGVGVVGNSEGDSLLPPHCIWHTVMCHHS